MDNIFTAIQLLNEKKNNISMLLNTIETYFNHCENMDESQLKQALHKIYSSANLVREFEKD